MQITADTADGFQATNSVPLERQTTVTPGRCVRYFAWIASKARLEAVPWTHLCRECKEHQRA